MIPIDFNPSLVAHGRGLGVVVKILGHAVWGRLSTRHSARDLHGLCQAVLPIQRPLLTLPLPKH